MAVIDNPMTFGRPRLDFASEHDIDEFVDMLGKYERAEITPEEWRRFRLVRGTYGQRQDNVQMLRIKIPQGIVTSSQMRALASVAARHSRGFCHVTTRQNIQYHFVQLSVCEQVMRDLAAEGLTTREACGNSVRNITGCQYAGTSDNEIFDPTPYAEAMTRYFLRHPLSGVLPRKFKIAFEGCREDHAFASINDIGWRAHPGRQARFPRDCRRRHLDPAGVRLRPLRVPAGRRDAQRRGSGGPRVPSLRRLRASPAQPAEVHDQDPRVGRLQGALRR